MARMLMELVAQLDVYAAAMSAAKAGGGAAAGYLLKLIWRCVVGDREECVVKTCKAWAQHKGLCVRCYKSAKARVESSQTTWEKLAEMGLAKLSDSPFDSAYDQATKE